MFKNFIKVALRNMARHKGFSLINIAGLTLGLTACLLIGLFVWDENQYDRFFPEGDQVYRVYNVHTDNEGSQNMAVTSPAYAPTIKQDFPEVEQTARVMMTSRFKILFETAKNKLYEENGFFIDSTFLQVFPLSLKYGSLTKALNDPASIVLSNEMAQRFFGNENPVGKQIVMNKSPYQVKAVFLRNPKFHLQFDFLVPQTSMGIPAERMQSWGWQQFFTYVKLKKGTDVHALELKFRNAVKQKATASIHEEYKYTPFFQSLRNIHLYSSDFKFDMAQRGNSTYVNALIIIAGFILLIACFNFVNLATARSLQRAKEVGVRKAIGAGRTQLMLQFTGETVLLTFISILAASALTIALLPWLNEFTGKHINASLFSDPVLLVVLSALTLVVGILAGIYPALILSGFKAINVLKGNATSNEQPGGIHWLRHGLVIVQFTLSILLIISAMVVFEQVSYLHNKDLGFNKDQIMFFPMRGDSMMKNYEAFKNEIQRAPGVTSVSIGYGFPGDAVAGDEIIVPRNGEHLKMPATQLIVDYDYIKTLGLQLVAGRDFSKDIQGDKDHSFIINETAVRLMGFVSADKALGKPLEWNVWGATNPDSLKTGQIIGVVKDFNYKSLYDKVETTVLQIFPDAYWKVAVKMNSTTAGNTINHIKEAWNKFTPEYPIEYNFLDENFEQMYRMEDKLKILVGVFTMIAVFVGCLGLFGLAAYTAERRRKEVGIRKVLGASVQGVVFLLSKDFIKLVLISLIIASPLAYYFMHQWLEDFAYRIRISGWVFVLAAILVTGIAIMTVSFQAIKAAMANPTKSLRTE